MGSAQSDADTPPQPPPKEKKPGIYEQAVEGYDQLVKAIIRPPRAEYEEAHLGPREFSFGRRRFRRRDFNLRNDRGMNIVCSMWEPFDSERPSAELPCVIYMHGNSSARVEGLPELALCLSIGATMLSFDFTGSGQSEGEYVSLGFFEREDLKTVVAHLRASGRVSTIGLWGRSMGAATALMHGDRDPSIAAMILDSPFSDLTLLAEDMVEKGRDQGLFVPGFVVSIAISFIRGSVKKTAGFNIRDISPIKNVEACFIPAFFVSGAEDDFILPKHSEAIHAKYAGDKNLVVVEGDHNSPRPRFLFDSAAIFLSNYLQLNPAWALENVDPYNNGYPPWVGSKMYSMRSALDYGDVDDEDDDDPYGAGLESAGMHDLVGGGGMTRSRQAATEAALFAALGGGGGGQSTGESTPSPPVLQASRVSVASGRSAPPVDSTRQPPWTCSVCTLINTGVASCTACGTVHV